MSDGYSDGFYPLLWAQIEKNKKELELGNKGNFSSQHYLT